MYGNLRRGDLQIARREGFQTGKSDAASAPCARRKKVDRPTIVAPGDQEIAPTRNCRA